MESVIQLFESMIEDEKLGERKYTQLAEFFEDLGQEYLAEQAQEMALDEEVHRIYLEEFINIFKRDYAVMSNKKGR